MDLEIVICKLAHLLDKVNTALEKTLDRVRENSRKIETVLFRTDSIEERLSRRVDDLDVILRGRMDSHHEAMCNIRERLETIEKRLDDQAIAEIEAVEAL